MKRNMDSKNFRVVGQTKLLPIVWMHYLKSPAKSPWSQSSLPMSIFPETAAWMEVLSEHMCQGWLEGYCSPAPWLLLCYEAFIHIVDSMFNQHAKWLKVTQDIPWRAPSPLELPPHSHVWRKITTVSRTGPGFIDHVVNKKADIVRSICSRRQYAPLRRRPLSAQPPLRQRHRGRKAARFASTSTCNRPSSTAPWNRNWEWASNDQGAEPDVVMACAGDIPRSRL